MYKSCCHISLPSLRVTDSAFSDLFSDDDLDAFINKVWKGGYKDGKLDRKRVSKYAGQLFEGVEKGYGKSLATVDYDTPDHKMLQSLANNVFHFSAAKNRAEIEALSAAMLNKKGNIVSFAEFKKRASKITGEFQGNWLRAEYDLAVNASTMAARWAEYDANDILIYRTAGDGRVRPEHALLNGVAKPASDPFWNTYFPPNGWNCRCDVEKTLSGKITPDKQLPQGAIDGVPPMFQVNLGKQGFAFPPDHPYFIICKEYRKKKSSPKNLADKKVNCGDQLGMSMSDARYERRKREGKGQTLISKAAYDEKRAAHETEGVFYRKEYQDRINCADAMAKHYDVAAHVTPEFQENKNDWRYKYFFKGVHKEGKQPDLKIDGVYWDVKSYRGSFTYGKLTSMMDAIVEKKQSPNLIMRLNHDVDIERVKHSLLGRLEKSAEKREYLKKIVIVDKNGAVHEVL